LDAAADKAEDNEDVDDAVAADESDDASCGCTGALVDVVVVLDGGVGNGVGRRAAIGVGRRRRPRCRKTPLGSWSWTTSGRVAAMALDVDWKA
jgi:hypothetical protein